MKRNNTIIIAMPSFVNQFLFIIGMLLTPPDVISQTLLAIPIWLLFEVGIIFAKILIKNRSSDVILYDDIDNGNEKKDDN